MSETALVLNLLVGAVWLGALLDLARRPPILPPSLSRGWRAVMWGAAAFVALVAGLWGPAVGTSTQTDFPREPAAEAPADEFFWMLRTPFAVVERRASVDGEGRTLVREHTETRQIPLALLAFLGVTLWMRLSPTRSRPSTAAFLLFTAITTLGACAPDAAPPEAAANRPERVMREVSWDTLVHIQSGLNDTLLFSVQSTLASESGFSVVDHIGHRVARFDWDGSLRHYIGRQGGGPGEFLTPRGLARDASGVLWVLDPQSARISGFDSEGALVTTVSTGGVDGTLDAFTVGEDGQAFYVMTATDSLVPWRVERSGQVTRGAAIPVATDAFSLALQGWIQRSGPGDAWHFGFILGDGFWAMDGLTRQGPRMPYREFVPFPGVSVTTSEDRSTGRSVRSTRPLMNTFAVISASVHNGILYTVFGGETEHRNRLLDRYDLSTGSYMDTVLLPRPGFISVHGDRAVLAGNNPELEILVLRAPW